MIMKKIFGLICLLPLFSSLLAQDYELNLRVIQNDRIVGGTFVLRVEARSLTGSSIATQSFSQAFLFNENALSVTGDQVVYDGTSWSGGNGVNGAPDATDAAKEIIVQSGTATLTGDVECEYFTVAAGADLVVGPNATLRPFVQDGSVGYNIADGVDGFLIDADATGYGQYMGPAVPGQINQYVGTDAGWRNIGFPVSGGTALTIGGGAANYSAASTSFNASPTCDGAWGNEISTVSVYRFNQGAQSHEWDGAAAAPSGGTEGYSIFAGAPFGTSGIASIKGTFLDPTTVGSYSYNHNSPHATGNGSQSDVSQGPGCIPDPVADHQANWDGWAIVANPFPCNMDVDAFSNSNGFAGAQIRVWNRSTGLYEDRSSGTTIAPMQAFWLKTGTSGTSLSIIFPDSIRTFTPAAFAKTVAPEVQLIATNTTTNESNAVHMRFNPLATPGYDQTYDAYVFNQPGNTFPQLSFHYVNANGVVSPLDYNTVPMPSAQTSYPLRFWSRSAGNYSFEVDQALLPPGTEVYIEDLKQAPGTHHAVYNGNTYGFRYDPVEDSPERFVMHFAPSGTIGFGEENMNSSQVYATSNDGMIAVHFSNVAEQHARIQVSNEVGQIVHLVDDVNTVDPYTIRLNSRKVGMYIIAVTLENGNTTYHKVVH
jgi:hypothetical protein